MLVSAEHVLARHALAPVFDVTILVSVLIEKLGDETAFEKVRLVVCLGLFVPAGQYEHEVVHDLVVQPGSGSELEHVVALNRVGLAGSHDFLFRESVVVPDGPADDGLFGRGEDSQEAAYGFVGGRGLFLVEVELSLGAGVLFVSKL